MIIDIQKEQTHFEPGDILRIKDGGVITVVFEARWTGPSAMRCERCDFANSEEECSLHSFCFDTRFLSVFYLKQ